LPTFFLNKKRLENKKVKKRKNVTKIKKKRKNLCYIYGSDVQPVCRSSGAGSRSRAGNRRRRLLPVDRYMRALAGSVMLWSEGRVSE